MAFIVVVTYPHLPNFMVGRSPFYRNWSDKRPPFKLAPVGIGLACQPAGERWSPSQALASGVAASL